MGKEDDFIGTQFTTPRGGILTVKECNGLKGNKKKYICECSICSNDSALWAYGSILSPKHKLTRGLIPCSCGVSPHLTDKQHYVIAQRKCVEYGYILHGWFGDYKGVKTYLDLENPKTSNRWNSCTLSNFIRGRKDPEEKKQKIIALSSKEDEKHIQDFYDAGFTEDYKFWRSDRVDSEGRKPYWHYTCPVCSQDEYVQAGVCTGIFESARVSLKKGQKSCRCAKSCNRTPEQREYQITQVCELESLRFLGWVDKEGYRTIKSKFYWLCSENHLCTTTVNEFIDQGNRCTSCAKYGYNKDASGNLYLVMWYSEDVSIIKFGITNNLVEKRINKQNSKTALSPKILYTYYHEKGGLIADIEAELKQLYKEYLTVPKYLLPDGYTEAIFYNETILNEIRCYIENRLK